MASAALTSPVLTALSRAKSSSSWTCWTRTSCRTYQEKACSCSAASTNHCSTVLGSTSNTRVVSLDSVDEGATKNRWSLADRADRESQEAPDSSTTPP